MKLKHKKTVVITEEYFELPPSHKSKVPTQVRRSQYGEKINWEAFNRSYNNWWGAFHVVSELELEQAYKQWKKDERKA